MPNEVIEGILVGTEYSGTKIVPKYVLSDTLIETMDLISEGEIQGPISGYWTFTGNLGQTGWTSGYFTPYMVPTGFTGISWLRSIYWDQMPVINEVGQFNFQQVDVVYTNGLKNGSLLQTITPLQTVSRTIGERLYGGDGVKTSYSKYYRILNTDCQGCVVNIRFPQLVYTDPNNGNIEDTQVEYIIQWRPIFSNPNHIINFGIPITENVNGKVTNGYIRSTRLDFDIGYLSNSDFMGWEIKVTRITPESNSSYTVNETFVDSITELYGNLYSYPNSAIVRANFNAQYFTQVPSRAFECELKKVKIPGNYDPVLRNYLTTGFATSNGGWNGQFATGKYYTNNPAWCFYDLITNQNYGLGRYIDSSSVDKFGLYDISQYCDVLVSDGRGSLEPRFTSNIILNDRNDAYKILNDFASIFRGLVYYVNGSIFTSQDSPKQAIVSFTNANVLDGDFTYSTSSRKTRNTVAILRFNDPFNFYQPALEYVEDFEGIRRYGIREVELTAFGCTSRAQANRLGRWALLSNNTETETINFTAGMEASYLRPGFLFKVFDRNKVGERNGGRTISISNLGTTGSNIVLDSQVGFDTNIQYTLSLLTPSYNYNPTQVSGISSNDISNINKSFIQQFNFSGFQSSQSGNYSIINLYQNVDTINYSISGNPIWVLELGEQYQNYTGNINFINPNYDYYRVINVTEKDVNQFDIVGLQYNPDKYGLIESGLQLQSTQLQLNNIPSTPYNFNSNLYTDLSNSTIINYSFLMDNFANVDSYKVYIKIDDFPNGGIPDNQYLLASLPFDQLSSSTPILYTGNYYFRVYASNDSQSLLSPGFASGAILVNNVNDLTSVIISSLEVTSYSGVYQSNSTNNISVINTNNTDPIFDWQVGFRGNSSIPQGLMYRATIRQVDDPNNIILSRIPYQTILYEITGITPTSSTYQWQFTLDTNVNLMNGPYRTYQLVIEAHDAFGNTSAGNICGQPDNNTWNFYPWAYDTLIYNNPRPSGIELSNYVLTQDTQTGTFNDITYPISYYSNQLLGTNGDVTVQFTSGKFDSDIVGGFMYVSSGQFPKHEVTFNSSYWSTQVQKTQFNFSPTYPYIYQPYGALNIKGAPSGYISLSFYDTLDQSTLNKGIDVSPNLYLSNNALISNNASVGTISIGGTNIIEAITTTGVPNGIIASGLIPNGAQILAITSTSSLNIPTTISTIVFITAPINIYSGVNPIIGGYPSGMQILMGDGNTTKPINQIKIGDQVASMFLYGLSVSNDGRSNQSNLVNLYNYTTDNYQTWFVESGTNGTGNNITPIPNSIKGLYELYNLNYSLAATPISNNYFNSITSSTVTRINSGFVSGYYVLNNNWTGTYNNNLVILTTGDSNNPPLWEMMPILDVQTGFFNSHFSAFGITNSQHQKSFVSANPINNIKYVPSGIFIFNLEVSPYKMFFISGGKGIDNNYLVHQAVYI